MRRIFKIKHLLNKITVSIPFTHIESLSFNFVNVFTAIIFTVISPQIYLYLSALPLTR